MNIGDKIGPFLTVIAFGVRHPKRGLPVIMKCRCGRTTTAQSSASARRRKSCGCQRRRGSHGMFGTRVYGIWTSMRHRCKVGNSESQHYGDRGIIVCERWKSFVHFYEDMGDPPSGTSLDRIDNNAEYSIQNCRWATRTQQGRNTRRNVLISAFGVTKCVTEWSEDTGIPRQCLYTRIRNGWHPEDAVTFPTRQGYKYRPKAIPRETTNSEGGSK